MIYLDYEMFKSKYLETQVKYNAILTEKEDLFTRTQPNAIRYDKERVQSSGGIGNGFDEYLIAKESKKIDERLEEVKSLLDDREKLLRLKEKELRLSNDKMDRIYLLRYVEGIKPHKIAKSLNYSVSQVYRVLNQIESSIQKNMRKNATK